MKRRFSKLLQDFIASRQRKAEAQVLAYLGQRALLNAGAGGFQ